MTISYDICKKASESYTDDIFPRSETMFRGVIRDDNYRSRFDLASTARARARIHFGISHF